MMLQLFNVQVRCTFNTPVLAHDQAQAEQYAQAHAAGMYHDSCFSDDQWETEYSDLILGESDVDPDDLDALPYRAVSAQDVEDVFGDPEPTVQDILDHWAAQAQERAEIEAADRRQTKLPFTAGHPGEEPSP